MGLIREPKDVDFVIEPHEVTEEDHLAVLAFIAACKGHISFIIRLTQGCYNINNLLNGFLYFLFIRYFRKS